MRQFASAPPSLVALTGHKNTHSSPAFNLSAFVSDCLGIRVCAPDMNVLQGGRSSPSLLI